ncbi:hypothetical protein SAMN06264364_101203 [Quadrisphaera granulorum]|uniref:Uncharacterized protein n=1 Tax=Quadrisphaera granulorum TaxID=317664 RepID=A0A316AG42_9ACTN|nr:hypothetical protein BXY45_101203 [Quadrisphaera granulorum]SZE94862.1 hypothetical protein SAMN06264364_101203 [Quadrisphaera granulorum]
MVLPAVLVSAATVSWAANCAVGLAAWRGRRGSHWQHHALYVSTCTWTLLALAASAVNSRSRTTTAVLAPALLPLVVVPRVRAGGTGHVLLAASLAPPFLGAAAAAWADVVGGD